MSDARTNVTAQYVALGRFVEAFERMVETARYNAGAILEPNVPRRKLFTVALHHQVMTAQPLFEILRGLIATKLGNAGFRRDYNISQREVDDFNGVLTNIATEYFALVRQRNNLLHATWRFGDTDGRAPPNFAIRKQAVGKAGLTDIDLPTNAKGLDELRERCDDVSVWIRLVCVSLPPASDTQRIKDVFEFKAGRWRTVGPSSRTLPSKTQEEG